MDKTSFQDRLADLWQRRERISSRKLPNREVAKACGMSVRAIGTLRNTPGRHPSAANLKALADFFGVDGEWLLTGKGEPSPVTSLSPEESELLLVFRSLSRSARTYIVTRAQEMFQDEYRRKSPAEPGNEVDSFPETRYQ